MEVLVNIDIPVLVLFHYKFPKIQKQTKHKHYNKAYYRMLAHINALKPKL